MAIKKTILALMLFLLFVSSLLVNSAVKSPTQKYPFKVFLDKGVNAETAYFVLNSLPATCFKRVRSVTFHNSLLIKSYTLNEAKFYGYPVKKSDKGRITLIMQGYWADGKIDVYGVKLYDKYDIKYFLEHELGHQDLWIKKQNPFNETYAKQFRCVK